MTQQVLDRPTAPEQKATALPEFPPLTANDRCEASTLIYRDNHTEMGTCGAQALVRAVLPDGLGEFLFCGHCIGEQTVGKNVTGTKAAKFADRRAALIKAGARLISNYDSINLRPTDPKVDGF